MGTVVCHMIPVSAMACLCTDTLELVFSPHAYTHTQLWGGWKPNALWYLRMFLKGVLPLPQLCFHDSLRLANE